LKLEDVRRDVKNAGMLGAGWNLAYRALNKVTRFMALTMLSVTPETVDASFLNGRPEHQHRFLTASELEHLSRDPANEMPAGFVAEALARGDRCYAILHGDVVASYGWYSRQETAVTEELSLRFSPQWAYMYKGFTRPEYRGQRLHAIGMALAMMEHSREGCHGLVSYVESNNYNSLKSCYRMGYVKAGTIVALRVGGRYLIRVGRGCAPFGLGLRAVRA
jgi:hypothetical protein